MKTVKLLSEENIYSDGKRINTQTIETTTTLGDDISQLANLQSNLASIQLSIENLNSKMPENETERLPFINEISRLDTEKQKLMQMIQLQETYINQFNT